jgi:hypothetical protein
MLEYKYKYNESHSFYSYFRNFIAETVWNVCILLNLQISIDTLKLIFFCNENIYIYIFDAKQIPIVFYEFILCN